MGKMSSFKVSVKTAAKRPRKPIELVATPQGLVKPSYSVSGNQQRTLRVFVTDFSLFKYFYTNVFYRGSFCKRKPHVHLSNIFCRVVSASGNLDLV